MANRQAQVLTSDNERLQKENSLLTVELDKLRLQLHEHASKPEQADP
jgi:regulator of replication initiation timing